MKKNTALYIERGLSSRLVAQVSHRPESLAQKKRPNSPPGEPDWDNCLCLTVGLCFFFAGRDGPNE